MRKTGPTNIHMRLTISELRKVKAPIWTRVADELAKSTRARRQVNLSRIEKYADGKRTIVVPGKVLGSGELTKKVTIAAWKFSDEAAKKILAAKGQVISLSELAKKEPKGKGVTILG